jgi:hypothetical protein
MYRLRPSIIAAAALDPRTRAILQGGVVAVMEYLACSRALYMQYYARWYFLDRFDCRCWTAWTNGKTKFGWTPLRWASENGREELGEFQGQV